MKKVELPDLKLGFVVRSEQGNYTTRDFYLFPLKTKRQQPAGACLFEVLKINTRQDVPLCYVRHGYITESLLRSVLFHRNNPGETPYVVSVAPFVPEDLSYRGLFDIQKSLMSPDERRAYDNKTFLNKLNNLFTTPKNNEGEKENTASPVWNMTFTYDFTAPLTGKWRMAGYRRLKQRDNNR